MCLKLSQLTAAAISALWAHALAAEQTTAVLKYNQDVRPILADNCFACHGPDSAARQADLRLDDRDAAVNSGAIVPGDPAASTLIDRITSHDNADRMPPLETKKTLTDAQKSTMTQWIRDGAVYEPHWSFLIPKRPQTPHVAHTSWVRNPIDAFIAASVEAAGLQPAPEADRRTLARRVSLDLTGLPPTPAAVEEFVGDQSPDAYERFVDELLESPHWGEHRGRYWLDAARYADTHGIHFDNYREMWSYRDWVIRAFNRNMPFDQFTIENLAGDLIPHATLDQRIGSGFNRCNITTSEGGAISEEYLVLYARDRTETTSLVWMGLTAGCAVCHDHKFDPLTQKEFYSLAAFFNNTTQEAMDGNIRNTPPVLVTPLVKDRQRWMELHELVVRARQTLARRKVEARPTFDAWIAEADPEEYEREPPRDGLVFSAPLNDGGDVLEYVESAKKQSAVRPPTVEWRPGRLSANAAYLSGGAALTLPSVGDFDFDHPYSSAAWVKLPANDGHGSIVARMEDGPGDRGWDMWVGGRRVGGHLVNEYPANAIKVVTKDPLPAEQWVHVALVYDGSHSAMGFSVYVNGKAQPLDLLADTLTETTRTKTPFTIGQRQSSSVLYGASVEDVRLYDRAITADEASALATSGVLSVLRTPVDKRTKEDIALLFDWWLLNLDEAFVRLTSEYDELFRELADIQRRGTESLVMQERSEAPMAFVLNRGEYDQRREQVIPDTPGFLPPFAEDLPQNRLGFAKWLLLPEHPLTARVTVNRFWQELFGAGLVRTAGDFGVTGELPSHPELLDWLAVEFRESGWDVKKFLKLLVMSATYRQSAEATREKLQRDPDNRLLSRGPRFRMDAEMVRDCALHASGLLVDKIGGPSVKPYQPPGVWEAVAMVNSNTRDYKQDAGESLYRRSLYTFWKRSAPPASMEVFNAPSREHCTICRERTNTPLQALVTLNDPQFIEAARHLAQQAIHAGGNGFADRLRLIAERVLTRPMSDEEAAVLEASLARITAYYAAHPADAKLLVEVGDSPADELIPPVELAAWTMVASEVMNLDEAINK